MVSSGKLRGILTERSLLNIISCKSMRVDEGGGGGNCGTLNSFSYSEENCLEVRTLSTSMVTLYYTSKKMARYRRNNYSVFI